MRRQLVIAAALVVAGSMVTWQTRASRAAPDEARATKKPPRDYELRLPKRSVITTGQRAAISLTISARRGYSISRAGPVSVRVNVSPKKGLTLTRRRYRRKHAADRRADDPRFDLVLRAERPGTYTVAIDARFWVCRRRSCRPIRERRAVTIEAQAKVPRRADAGPG